MKNLTRLLLFLLLVTGCTHNKGSDKQSNQMGQDSHIQEMSLLNHTMNNNNLIANNMIIKSALEIESEPFEGADRLISLTIDSDVDVKNLLREISDLADIDVDIDPGISGRMILKIHDRKVSDVFRHISDKAHIRYYVNDGIVHFVRNYPFIKHYKLDLLNMVRSANNSFDVNTKVLGSGGEGGLGSAGGSSSQIQANYQDDVWESIKKGLEDILGKYDDLYNSIEKYQNSFDIADSAKTTETNTSVSPSSQAVGIQSFVTVSKQTGVLSVFTTHLAHEEIAKYLKNIQRKISAQVLIEAKIVEVVLRDDYSAGIDWTVYDPNTKNTSTSGDIFSQYDGTVFGLDPQSSIESSQGSQKSLVGGLRWKSTISVLNNYSINASVTWLKSFGNTRIVSSPRISTINNQQAIISFVQNSVYFDTKVTEEEDTTNNTNANTNDTTSKKFTIDSTIKTVPVGIILSLQPSIDLERGEVSISLRPSISRIVDNIQNPATEYAIIKTGAASQLKGASSVPIIEVRTMDSIVKLKSGGVMAIGGLHEKRVEERENGIPFLYKIPLLGNIFKVSSKTVKNIETVIILKATIIDDFNGKDNFAQKYWDY